MIYRWKKKVHFLLSVQELCWSYRIVTWETLVFIKCTTTVEYYVIARLLQRQLCYKNIPSVEGFTQPVQYQETQQYWPNQQLWSQTTDPVEQYNQVQEEQQKSDYWNNAQNEVRKCWRWSLCCVYPCTMWEESDNNCTILILCKGGAWLSHQDWSWNCKNIKVFNS